jgi:hypothetical protein
MKKALILLLIFLSACAPSEAVMKVTVQAAIAQTQAALPSATAIPTNTVFPTETPTLLPTDTLIPTETPSLTVTPMSGKGSRESPILIGGGVSLTRNHEQDFFITITEIKRGTDAWNALYGANQFNSMPKDPMQEYLLALIEIYYVKGPSDKTLDISSSSFGSVSNNTILSQPFAMVDPEPQFEHQVSTGLFAPSQAKGWLTFYVFKNDPNPLIYFGNPKSGPVWYFAIK